MQSTFGLLLGVVSSLFLAPERQILRIQYINPGLARSRLRPTRETCAVGRCGTRRGEEAGRVEGFAGSRAASWLGLWVGG